ncbi:hypothetical protein [Moorena producens]|nr:hypothetical protein [Moorena producens]
MQRGHGGNPHDRAASISHFGLIFLALTLELLSIIFLILMISPSFGRQNVGNPNQHLLGH